MHGLSFVTPAGLANTPRSPNQTPELQRQVPVSMAPARRDFSVAVSPSFVQCGSSRPISMRQPMLRPQFGLLGNPGGRLGYVQSVRCQAQQAPDAEAESHSHNPDIKKNIAKGIEVLRAANEPHPSQMQDNLLKPFNLTPTGKAARQVIKRGMYAQLALGHSAYILAGKAQPLIEFRVEDAPPSLFINYRIKPGRLNDFRQAFGIPEHIKMLPMQCVENGESGYLLSVNVYAVSGITTGLRAEESVYIDRGDGKASYLVLGATTDNFSMDPVDIVTVAGDLAYDKHENDLKISYTKGHSGKFEFKCAYDASAPDIEQAKPLAPWIAANDLIFWPNGVCDRAFYNGDLVNEPVNILSPKNIKTENTLPWAEFVEPEPVEAFALTKPLDFVISPWHNIDD